MAMVRTKVRILQWFSDHWPADLEWPPDISRPARKVRILQRFSDHWPAHLEWPSDIPRPAPSSTDGETAGPPNWRWRAA